jgi:hypothetical protein
MWPDLVGEPGRRVGTPPRARRVAHSGKGELPQSYKHPAKTHRLFSTICDRDGQA